MQASECCGLYVFLISAGLAPAGSQLVGYNERSALARSPSGLPRWKQRLGCLFCRHLPSNRVSVVLSGDMNRGQIQLSLDLSSVLFNEWERGRRESVVPTGLGRIQRRVPHR